MLDPETFELDHKGTEQLRAKVTADRGEVPLTVPTKADAATWLEENMRDGDNHLLDPIL